MSDILAIGVAVALVTIALVLAFIYLRRIRWRHPRRYRFGLAITFLVLLPAAVGFAVGVGPTPNAAAAIGLYAFTLFFAGMVWSDTDPPDSTVPLPPDHERRREPAGVRPQSPLRRLIGPVLVAYAWAAIGIAMMFGPESWEWGRLTWLFWGATNAAWMATVARPRTPAKRRAEGDVDRD